MIKILTIFLLLPFTMAWPGIETIVPDATDSPDDWASSNVDTKVDNVTDGVDGEYILEDTDEGIQMFTLSNTTFDAGVTVDSFHVVWRGQDNGGGTNLVRMEPYTDASNYCYGANVGLGVSWTDYTDKFTGSPDGIASCGGTLTKSVMDNLKIKVHCTELFADREVRVTDIDVIIYYTEVDEEVGTIMRTVIR